MLMSQKKTLPLRAAGRYTSRGHPAEAVLQQKRYEKMCMLQRVSGNLIGCVEPIGNKYHGTNPKSFAKETPPRLQPILLDTYQRMQIANVVQ